MDAPGGPLVPAALDPERWLRMRRDDEYDEEDIGALAVPAPGLAEVSADVSSAYVFA